jgi:predicted amidohydrolase YtcJ
VDLSCAGHANTAVKSGYEPQRLSDLGRREGTAVAACAFRGGTVRTMNPANPTAECVVDVNEIPPLIQIEAALTRKRPGFPADAPFVPRQRMDLDRALRAYTINAAFQLRMEKEIGSIEVGKKADLVVLGQDLFTVAPENVHSAPVRITMMDGRVTFG